EPRDEFGLRALCDELLAHLREPFAPARREPRIGCCYTCGRLVRRRHLVVTTHDRIEPAGADQADLERDDDQPNWRFGPRPDLISEMRAAIWLRIQIGCDALLCDGAARQAAHDAEANRAHPLERLLHPFDG